MGSIVDNSVNFIKEKYPELAIKYSNGYVGFEGRFIINAIYKDFEVNIAPRLLIILPIDYPRKFPLVFDLKNSYPSEHRLDNDGLCVATPFDLILELSTSNSIEDYITKFLIPYFLSIVIEKKTGQYIFGERKHGLSGVYESIADFFDLKSDQRELMLILLRWASKKQRLCKIYSIDRQYLIQKFSSKIGELRSAGILGLRKVYKLLAMDKELEKRSFTYVNKQ